MDNNKADFISLAEKMYDSIKIYGTNTVINKLNELKVNSSTQEQTLTHLFDAIITCVCNEYKVNFSQLKKSRVLGNCRFARTTCILMFKKHLSFSVADITRIFGRDSHSVISLSIKEYNEMKPTIKHHKDFLETLQKIDSHIEEYKNSLILKTTANEN